MLISAPEKLLIKIARILKSLKIKYFVTGGFAVSVWGRPRATFDIDIVVKLIEPQVLPLVKMLRKISQAGYIDEQTARQAIIDKGEFNFIDPASGLKVDFWITKGDRLALLEFQRKRLEKIDSQDVYFISPEDLILSKLKWYKKSQSSQQIEDVKSILKISGAKLDKKYLKQWAGKLKVLGILNGLW